LTTLLVASTGGHLKQLHRLRTRLDGISGPFRWATFDTPQSRSLLDGEQVDFVHFVGGRDPGNVLRNIPIADDILRRHKIDTIVSTGSAVALPFFALGRVRRLACHYIESAARSDGPSKTARMISRIPGVHLYAQYPAWADDKWHYAGAVFDSFVLVDEPLASKAELRKVVVSLGTFKDIGFARLIRRLVEILPRDADVLWQTGDTDVSGLGIVGHHAIPERELTEAIRSADVLVAHAGVGTALAAFEVGKCPVLVPRRAAHAEHVDDHQTQIAAELSNRGLAVSVDADSLTLDHLVAAAGMRVATLQTDPPFMTRARRRAPRADRGSVIVSRADAAAPGPPRQTLSRQQEGSFTRR
jgi:UDP-N-acetylglucosamine transferase subunit ALG13